MKLSQKQASLLAREIVKKLQDKKVQKVPESIKNQIQKFCDKRKELYNKKADVQEEINKHEATLYNIVGRIKNLYTGDSFNKIIEKVEEKNIPEVREIEDEIILKSMFASEDDMQKFVDSIVKKYEKKVQSKILIN